MFAENISNLEGTVHSTLIYGVTYTIPPKNYNFILIVTFKKKDFSFLIVAENGPFINNLRYLQHILLVFGM
jgi:hypothetical protein